MPNHHFRFKQFTVLQARSTLKVGTDGVLLGAWTDYSEAKRILDVGTGTGVLALIAAQRAPAAWVDAVEIDDVSAEEAQANAAASPWSDRVRVHRMDVRRMRAGEPYDLIICNPPYYGGEMRSSDERSGVAKHSGELLFAELMEVADRMLTDRGALNVIVPKNRESAFLDDAAHVDIHPARHCEVRYLEGRPPKRTLLQLRRGEQATLREEIIVETSPGGNYTPQYRALLSDLMLKF